MFFAIPGEPADRGARGQESYSRDETDQGQGVLSPGDSPGIPNQLYTFLIENA